ncbi:antitoxin [Nocardia transvalensis]|uniref:antitoxin n=1 Tax=Nocardia transvalensis TaxID=37333 RepID=UPI0018942310|nr:antitoxin [Nocardia transvalensis]MBF6334175.1 antitoxin [Nocardia transvalensis]
MSLLDTLKGLVGKGRDAASENAEKIHGAVDKAGGYIDQKTGGKYSDKIEKGTGAIKKAVPEQQSPGAQGQPAPPPPPPPAPAPPKEPPATPGQP